ncbi:unnamed protein product [Dicrocoelium dendriticum]|nr:unnamed protein product [Dicrocoelium dendriticum]
MVCVIHPQLMCIDDNEDESLASKSSPTSRSLSPVTTTASLNIIGFSDTTATMALFSILTIVVPSPTQSITVNPATSPLRFCTLCSRFFRTCSGPKSVRIQ